MQGRQREAVAQAESLAGKIGEFAPRSDELEERNKALVEREGVGAAGGADIESLSRMIAASGTELYPARGGR